MHMRPDTKEYLNMPPELRDYITESQEPGDGVFCAISAAGVNVFSSLRPCSAREAMALCLDSGIWPERFRLNRGILTAQAQATLLRSQVAVIGCGGLGGILALLLARAGVGALTLCDGDIFTESNLNRQMFCYADTLGVNKAEAAAKELLRAAPYLSIRIVSEFAQETTLPGILADAGIAADCLDNAPFRFILEKAARDLGIPLVHAAIGGLNGFACVSNQENGCLRQIYGVHPPKHGTETQMGNPAITPSVVAAVQAWLVIRELVGMPGTSSRVWHLDLVEPELTAFYLT